MPQTSARFCEGTGRPWLLLPHHKAADGWAIFPLTGTCNTKHQKREEETHFKSAQCSLPSGALANCFREQCVYMEEQV